MTKVEALPQCAIDSVYNTESLTEPILDGAYDINPIHCESSARKHVSLAGVQSIDHRYFDPTKIRTTRMSRVFRAHDAMSEGHVAVKFLKEPDEVHRQHASQEIELHVFKLEGVAGILPAIDTGNFEEGNFTYRYCVTPYCEQGTLSRLPVPTTTQDVGRVALIVGDAAGGLNNLHRLTNFVHCDVKPKNIFINSDGRGELGDFGLVSEPTTRGGRRGTLGYMPLEAMGGEIVPAFDSYGLGAALYEGLTGITPHVGERCDDATASFDDNVPDDTAFVKGYRAMVDKIALSMVCRDLPPPSYYNEIVPKALDEVTMNALAFSPEDRREVGDIRERLGRIVAGLL